MILGIEGIPSIFTPLLTWSYNLTLVKYMYNYFMCLLCVDGMFLQIRSHNTIANNITVYVHVCGHLCSQEQN